MAEEDEDEEEEEEEDRSSSLSLFDQDPGRERWERWRANELPRESNPLVLDPEPSSSESRTSSPIRSMAETSQGLR